MRIDLGIEAILGALNPWVEEKDLICRSDFIPNDQRSTMTIPRSRCEVTWRIIPRIITGRGLEPAEKMR